MTGRSIGPYHLIELLGRGGMGEVFLAEQRKPVRRRVALKVALPGEEGDARLARFAAEREALSRLDHFNVPHLLDEGVTPEGLPYFAMEVVDGVPITRFCDAERLDLEERLRLFLQVCEGVEHAHVRGVIHRDLKSGNILVTRLNEVPVAKIIDFGVSHARGAVEVESPGPDGPEGTPAFMSPEQASASPENVDHRTDIYSLGVVLYGLLVGALPIDPKALRGAADFGEVGRILRETIPIRPSVRILELGEPAAAMAEKRCSTPRALAGRCRGEIDRIVMRCLEKDRAKRYGRVAELAEDLRARIRGSWLSRRGRSWSRRWESVSGRTGMSRSRCVALAVGIAAMVGVAWILLFSPHHARVAREGEAADRLAAHLSDAWSAISTGAFAEAEARIHAYPGALYDGTQAHVTWQYEAAIATRLVTGQRTWDRVGINEYLTAFESRGAAVEEWARGRDGVLHLDNGGSATVTLELSEVSGPSGWIVELEAMIPPGSILNVDFAVSESQTPQAAISSSARGWRRLRIDAQGGGLGRVIDLDREELLIERTIPVGMPRLRLGTLGGSQVSVRRIRWIPLG